MNGANISISSVGKEYPGHTALDSVSLEIFAGSYTVILGPSGSGKTTLLGILGGFVAPTSGLVTVDGEDVTRMSPSRRPTTTVFQDYALFPHMTVQQNVAFGLEMQRVPKRTRQQQVKEILELVGLGHLANRNIADLSGGQRQRIALARALIVKPRVLLLDEPLGALDLKLRRQMQDELTQIHREVGTTFVHVTHDQEEAMSLADSIVVLRDGNIEDMGAPARLYLEPATAFSARFMGDSNITEGSVDPGSDVVVTPWGSLEVAGARIMGRKQVVSLRPEHIALADQPSANLGAWTITQSHFLGDKHRVIAQRDELELLVSLPQSESPRVGNTILLAAKNGMAKLVEGERSDS